MSEIEKGKVYNHDVAALSQMFHRVGVEVHRSNSANVSAVSQFDYKRYKEYLSWIEGKIDWITSQALLDLPESNPKQFMVDEAISYTRVENEAVNDMLRMIEIAIIELHNSQSARFSSNLIKQDNERVRGILTKMNSFLDEFVEKHLPLDVPESSPAMPMAPAGRLGV